jgi:hypothetical protein
LRRGYSAKNSTLATLVNMGELERRGTYTPRRARERRAYQLVVAGGVAGVVGVVGIVLAVTGVIGAGLPIIALIVAALCVLGFMRMVGTR